MEAPTIRPLLAWLGLGELALRDQAIRDRAMAQTLAHVTEIAAQAIESQDIEEGLAASQFGYYERRVEAANDVLSVDAAAVEDPPALTSQGGLGLVRAVVRRPDAPPVMVLSIEALLEAVYRSALSRRGGES